MSRLAKPQPTVTVTLPACTGPDCNRPAVVHGLCRGHYQQRKAHPRQALRPLRAYGTGDAYERVSLRVEKAVRRAVLNDPDGAREALAAWAAKGSR